MTRSKIVQRELEFVSWGGAREGAGRKRKSDRPSVPHSRRPALAARHPVHVTLRIAQGLPYMRNGRIYGLLKQAFRAGRERFGFRLVHFAVLSNHVHLVVEAEGSVSLSRGMQGLAVRMARALNRAWRRAGSVFDGRYHAHVLRTPREVRNALAYVLGNARKHGAWLRRGAVDPFSSAMWFDGWSNGRRGFSHEDGDAPVARARTWLLGMGWRRQGAIPLVPA